MKRELDCYLEGISVRSSLLYVTFHTFLLKYLHIWNLTIYLLLSNHLHKITWSFSLTSCHHFFLVLPLISYVFLVNLIFLSQQMSFVLQCSKTTILFVDSFELELLITLFTVGLEEIVGRSWLLHANLCLGSREVSEVELAKQESMVAAYCSSKRKSFAYRSEM